MKKIPKTLKKKIEKYKKFCPSIILSEQYQKTRFN